MPTAARQRDLETLREQVAARIRGLRQEHRWTQKSLAQQLDLSQSRLSEIENGQGSFTAEQFLKLLRLFNVPASHFGGPEGGREGQTQNALHRLGARHLRHDPHVLPGEDLDAGAAIREALVDGHPRLVVSAAVVLVHNIERIHVKRVQMDLVDVGAAGRLPWLIHMLLHATTLYLSEQGVPDRWAARLRRVEAALSPFQEAFEATRDTRRPLVWDVLDPSIRSKQTTEEVKLANSAVSNYWWIVTRLHVEDFVSALRSASADA
jgi:transcriptional regulator with XRE-family HTH domain